MLEMRIGGIPLRVSLLFPAAVVVLLTLDTAGHRRLVPDGFGDA